MPYPRGRCHVRDDEHRLQGQQQLTRRSAPTWSADTIDAASTGHGVGRHRRPRRRGSVGRLQDRNLRRAQVGLVHRVRPALLVTSVGTYRDVDGVPQPLDNIPGLSVSEVGGSSLPLSMWLDFMKAATQGMEVQQFPSGPASATTPSRRARRAPRRRQHPRPPRRRRRPRRPRPRRRRSRRPRRRPLPRRRPRPKAPSRRPRPRRPTPARRLTA